MIFQITPPLHTTVRSGIKLHKHACMLTRGGKVTSTTRTILAETRVGSGWLSSWPNLDVTVAFKLRISILYEFKLNCMLYLISLTKLFLLF